jgi:hypothetical protein
MQRMIEQDRWSQVFNKFEINDIEKNEFALQIAQNYEMTPIISQDSDIAKVVLAGRLR